MRKDRNRGQRTKEERGKREEARNSAEKKVSPQSVLSLLRQCQCARQSVSQSPWLQQDRCPGFDLHMLFRAWSHHLSLSLFFLLFLIRGECQQNK